ALGKSLGPTSVMATTPRPLGVTPIAGYTTFLPSTPFVPVRATLPLTEPVERSGLTMYQATPAFLWAGFASKLTAVSSAPHTLPFAYITCCMRVSFESRRETTSAPRAAWTAGPTSSFQQPLAPLKRTVVSLLRQ